jgi:hypothetical protein
MTRQWMSLMIAAWALPCAAQAQGFYAGGGAGIGEVEYRSDFGFDPGVEDDTVGAVIGIGGYRVNRFFAMEANLVGVANGEDEDELEVSFGAVSASVLGVLPASEQFDLFLRLGWYTGASEVGIQDDESESGLVYGGGGQVSFGPRERFSVRMDFLQYETEELEDLWFLAGGFFYNFGR